MKRKLRDVR